MLIPRTRRSAIERMRADHHHHRTGPGRPAQKLAVRAWARAETIAVARLATDHLWDRWSSRYSGLMPGRRQKAFRQEMERFFSITDAEGRGETMRKYLKGLTIAGLRRRERMVGALVLAGIPAQFLLRFGYRPDLFIKFLPPAERDALSAVSPEVDPLISDEGGPSIAAYEDEQHALSLVSSLPIHTMPPTARWDLARWILPDITPPILRALQAKLMEGLPPRESFDPEYALWLATREPDDCVRNTTREPDRCEE